MLDQMTEWARSEREREEEEEFGRGELINPPRRTWYLGRGRRGGNQMLHRALRFPGSPAFRRRPLRITISPSNGWANDEEVIEGENDVRIAVFRFVISNHGTLPHRFHLISGSRRETGDLYLLGHETKIFDDCGEPWLVGEEDRSIRIIHSAAPERMFGMFYWLPLRERERREEAWD